MLQLILLTIPQQSPNFCNVALRCLDIVEPLIVANEWVDIKLKIKRKILAFTLDPALWPPHYQGLKNTWISACPVDKQCWNKCSSRALSKLWFRFVCSWPSMRKSRWLDIGQVVFCFFMDQDKVKVMGPSFHLHRLPFRSQDLLQLAHSQIQPHLYNKRIY